MNSDKAIAKAVVYVVLLSFVGGIIAMGIGYQHDWSETGKISWVGVKFYNDNTQAFQFPFSVTVPIHGTFNFTDTGQVTICGNASAQTSAVVGTVVALIRLHCGGYDLVVDP